MLLSLKKKVSILLTAVLMVVSTSTVYADESTSPTDGNTTLATANVTLSSTRNPAAAGEPITFMATVEGSSGMPSGTVTLTENGVELGSGRLGTDVTRPREVFIMVPNLDKGDHQIVAKYSGSTTYAPSETAPFAQSVRDSAEPSFQTSAQLTVTSLLNPSNYGNSVTFNIRLDRDRSGNPSGSVILMDGETELARLAMWPDGVSNGDAKASFTTDKLSVGSHPITAKYYGDTRYDLNDMISETLTQVVNAPANGGGANPSLRQTTTSVASTRNPASEGEPVTFVARVSRDSVNGDYSYPSGTVTFKDGTTVLGTAEVGEDPVHPDFAYLAVRSLEIGDHPITAEYNGDAKFGKSLSAPLTQSVRELAEAPTEHPTVTKVTSYRNPSKFGESVTFDIRVKTDPQFTRDIAGSVILMDGTKELATIAMTPGGVANGVAQGSFTTSDLSVGDHPITAKYTGDRRYEIADSTSEAMIQVVQASGGSPAPEVPVPTPNPIPSYDPPYTTPDVPAQPPVPTAPAVPVQEEKPAAESPKTIEEGQNPDDIFRSRVVSADSNVIAGVEVRTADILSKGSSFASVTYGDVAQHWAFPSIEKLTKLGVINGYPNGGFEPNEAITRAEFAAMIERGFVGMASRQVDMNDADFAKFSDIQGHWSSNNLKKLVAVGVLTGYEDGTIRPNQTISRQEMALIITRVLNANILSVDTSKVEFSDLDGVYAADVIKKTTALGIFEGKTEGNFDPNSGATRAEAIETIIKTYSLSPSIKAALEKLN
ncbi:hypothetical protein CDO73_00365 [Saccharibacillus sp. O23]|uniref:Ig-like domain repeat protein n=1 Tax=Saccharibacillus sp. O23 TaxID=2009338 RepID=UPI000B4DFD2A|nr:Ig-like domain repeat protein [Saccharibacillus sp. O23]OWR32997.1 hypothetical protein CDO73_00365 [Saccharibacillus sp. O23]